MAYDHALGAGRSTPRDRPGPGGPVTDGKFRLGIGAATNHSQRNHEDEGVSHDDD